MTDKTTRFSLLTQVKSRPRYQRWSLYLGTTYCLYALLLGVLAPSMLTQALPDQINTLTGRNAQLDSISINPFLLRVTINEFHIKPNENQDVHHPAEEDGFSGFERFVLEVNFWHSLINQAISIETVSLTKPYGFIAAKRTPANSNQKHPLEYSKLRFNFSDILDKLATSQETQPATEQENSALPRILLNHLNISAGKLKLFDTLTQTQINYNNLNIQLRELDSQYKLTSQQLGNRFSVQLTGADGSQWQTQGQIQVFPLNLEGELTLGRIQLTPFWPLIAKHVEAKLGSGRISVANHYQIKQDDEAVTFSISKGQFSLEELSFTHQQKSLLELPLFALENLQLDSAQKQLHIDQLFSQNLNTHLVLDKQGLNLVNLLTPDLLKRPSTAPNITSHNQATTENQEQTRKQNNNGDANTKADDTPWRVTLDKTNIENYQLSLIDNKTNANQNHWHIDNVNLKLGQFVSDLSTTLNYDLGLRINQTGELASRGELDLASSQANVGYILQNFPLPNLQGYLSPFINIQLSQGKLDTQGQVQFTPAQDIQLESDLYIKELDIKALETNKSGLSESLLSWQNLKINKIIYKGLTQELTLDTIGLSQPYAKVIINEDRSTNIGDLIVKQESSETRPIEPSAKTQAGVDNTQATGSQAQELKLTIGRVLIDKGSAYFSDKSLKPNFGASIEELQGGISQLTSSGSKKAKVDISGKIDRYAPVTLKGELNPLLADPYLDLALDFNNVELTSVNPYSGTYAGYYIDKGQLSLALNYQLENNQLKGDNRLVIDQLELGKPSNSELATSLPVSLAIALLQDTNGVIDLDMQVSGDVNSPDFSVGNIIMTAVTNVITKAVTSPFSLLANLIGTDEELDKLSYALGSNELAQPQQQKLEQLAQALAKRPKLSLSVEGAVDLAGDTQALKAKLLAKELHSLVTEVSLSNIEVMGASSLASDPKLGRAIVKLYENRFDQSPKVIKANIEKQQTPDTPKLTAQALDVEWKIALYNLCINDTDVSQAMLGQLAQERAQKVKIYMVETLGSPAQSIFIKDSRINTQQSGAMALLSLDAK